MFKRSMVLAGMAVVLLATQAVSQPKPPPEMDKLKEMEGTWEAVVKHPGGEMKGSVTYKLELGGFWLIGDFKGDISGTAFSGRSADSYDPVKKKYVSLWIDSMASSPMIMEGEMDKSGKVTMTGTGPGEDGKTAKFRTVTERKDKDTTVWTMYGVGADGKEMEMMTVTYKRKK